MFFHLVAPPLDRGTTCSIEHALSVGAPVIVALPKMLQSQSWPLHRHLVKLDRNDDAGHTDNARGRVYPVVLLSDGQFQPIFPTHGHKVSLTWEIHRGGNIGAHHDQRFLDSHDIDRLPGTVQNQNLLIEIAHVRSFWLLNFLPVVALRGRTWRII